MFALISADSKQKGDSADEIIKNMRFEMSKTTRDQIKNGLILNARSYASYAYAVAINKYIKNDNQNEFNMAEEIKDRISNIKEQREKESSEKEPGDGVGEPAKKMAKKS